MTKTERKKKKNVLFSKNGHNFFFSLFFFQIFDILKFIEIIYININKVRLYKKIKKNKY